nr:MAG TPA: hypothetical protein [Caudoviricetes sp.]
MYITVWQYDTVAFRGAQCCRDNIFFIRGRENG